MLLPIISSRPKRKKENEDGLKDSYNGGGLIASPSARYGARSYSSKTEYPSAEPGTGDIGMEGYYVKPKSYGKPFYRRPSVPVKKDEEKTDVKETESDVFDKPQSAGGLTVKPASGISKQSSAQDSQEDTQAKEPEEIAAPKESGRVKTVTEKSYAASSAPVQTPVKIAPQTAQIQTAPSVQNPVAPQTAAERDQTSAPSIQKNMPESVLKDTSEKTKEERSENAHGGTGGSFTVNARDAETRAKLKTGYRPEKYSKYNVWNHYDRVFALASLSSLTEEEKREAREILKILDWKNTPSSEDMHKWKNVYTALSEKATAAPTVQNQNYTPQKTTAGEPESESERVIKGGLVNYDRIAEEEKDGEKTSDKESAAEPYSKTTANATDKDKSLSTQEATEIINYSGAIEMCNKELGNIRTRKNEIQKEISDIVRKTGNEYLDSVDARKTKGGMKAYEEAVAERTKDLRKELESLNVKEKVLSEFMKLLEEMQSKKEKADKWNSFDPEKAMARFEELQYELENNSEKYDVTEEVKMRDEYRRLYADLVLFSTYKRKEFYAKERAGNEFKDMLTDGEAVRRINELNDLRKILLYYFNNHRYSGDADTAKNKCDEVQKKLDYYGIKKEQLRYMDADDIRMVVYLYSHGKEPGVGQYLNDMQAIFNYRQGEEEAYRLLNTKGLKGVADRTKFAWAAGVEQAITDLGTTFSDKSKPQSAVPKDKSYTYHANDILAEGISGKKGIGKFEIYLYNAAYDLGKDTPSLLVKALAKGLGLSAVGADLVANSLSSLQKFGGEYNKGLLKGASHEQAQAYAAAEAGLAFALDSLLDDEVIKKIAPEDLIRKVIPYAENSITEFLLKKSHKFGKEMTKDMFEEAFSKAIKELLIGDKLNDPDFEKIADKAFTKALEELLK
ncbi:MAG: hypothetical protein IJS65_03330 [Clostridia bacterium]|nr:hypothetical protein [Clostridia bacterium]